MIRFASGQLTFSVSGYQRSARSHTRCLPRRATTATSPRAFSTPSIRPILRSPHQRCGFAPARVVVLDLTREQRPASLELAQHVAAEGGVLLQVLELVAVERAVAPCHPRPEQRQVLGRPEERVPLEQLSLLPDEAVELRAVVAGRACSRGRGAAAARPRRSGRAAGSRGGERCPARRSPSRRGAVRARRSGALPRRTTSRMLDPLQPEDAREARRSFLELPLDVATHVRLGGEAADPQHALRRGRPSGRRARRSGRRRAAAARSSRTARSCSRL